MAFSHKDLCGRCRRGWLEGGDFYCDPTGEKERDTVEWTKKQAWRWPGLTLARPATEMCPGFWEKYNKERIVEKVRSRIRWLERIVEQHVNGDWKGKTSGPDFDACKAHYRDLCAARKWKITAWGHYPQKGVLP